MFRILGLKTFTAKSTDWGKEHEAKALEAYVKHQQDSGHQGLFACKSGFVISETHPFLGVSPDACVHDPLHDEPFGLVEIKCPYSHRNNTPEIACSSRLLLLFRRQWRWCGTEIENESCVLLTSTGPDGHYPTKMV